MTISNARAVPPSRTLCTALALALIGASMQSLADSPQVVQKMPAPAGHTIWRISNPTVNEASTQYPQIVFAPGQTVTVTATGCVQTGGAGLTWKRYVDPVGDNSATLYHGQILIPGAVNPLQFYDPRQPTVYTIPKTATLPAGAHLTLGYTDDHYSDNGYSSHDNGNQNQCWEVGNAAITLDIAPLAPATPPASQNYILTLQNVMIRNLRSSHSDTDIFGAAVTVNGTQAAIASQSVGSDWEQGSHNFPFSIEVDEVEPTDRVDFTYTVLNAGHSNTAQSINNAIVAIVQKVAGSIQGAGTIVSGVATAEQAIVNILDADCDGPVVADSIMGTGNDLALWTQNGPMTRTMSFSGTHSSTGCGSNSFYEVTYSIARTSQVLPYSLQINARSLAVKTSQNVQRLAPTHP